MRHLVVLVVLLLVSAFAGTAHAAEPTLVGATASPSTAAPGQPVRLTATLSEPAPAGGTEVELRIYADWYPTPIRVLVPAGERSVSYDWVPPTGFKPLRDYQVNLRSGASTARAYFRANGLTDAGGYAVTAFDAPPTLVAGRSYPATTTINRPAPAGGLLVDRQIYGSYQPQIFVSPAPVLFPAGSRRAQVTMTAPEPSDIIAPRRSLLGLGLGCWGFPAGGPTFQKIDINPLVVPKWFSITYGAAIPAGGGTTLGLGLGEDENPSGTYVSLTSDNPAVIVPSQVYVPPGHSGVEFPVSVSANPTSRAARVTARWRGLLSTSDIQIPGTSLPEPAPTPTPTPFPDWLAPRTTLIAYPTGDVSGPVSISFGSTEAGSTFLCSLSSDDGFTLADREPCSSPKTYSGLEPGGFRFKVQAVDAAGNVDLAGRSPTFTIVGPARPVPPAPAFDAPATVTLPEVTVRGTSESGARIEIVDRWAWNAPLWPANVWTGVASPEGTWSVLVEQLAEGAHWLSARAINRTGTGPWSPARTVTVDTGGTPNPTPTPTATPTATPTPTTPPRPPRQRRRAPRRPHAPPPDPRRRARRRPRRRRPPPHRLQRPRRARRPRHTARHTDADADAHRHTDSNGHAEPDAHRHANSADPDRDTVAHRHAEPHPDAARPHGHPDAHARADRDAVADPRRLAAARAGHHGARVLQLEPQPDADAVRHRAGRRDGRGLRRRDLVRHRDRVDRRRLEPHRHGPRGRRVPVHREGAQPRRQLAELGRARDPDRHARSRRAGDHGHHQPVHAGRHRRGGNHRRAVRERPVARHGLGGERHLVAGDQHRRRFVHREDHRLRRQPVPVLLGLRP